MTSSPGPAGAAAVLLPWTWMSLAEAATTIRSWRPAGGRMAAEQQRAHRAAAGLLDLLERAVATEEDPTIAVGRGLHGAAVLADGMPVRDARSILSSWHFAKEMLSEHEARLLYVAEGVLRALDERSEGYLQ